MGCSSSALCPPAPSLGWERLVAGEWPPGGTDVGGELLVVGELPVGALVASYSESWWQRLVGGEPSAGSMLPLAVSCR